MHYFAAVASFAAALLYADRSGWLLRNGTQSGWALLTRAGVAGWMVSNTIGFLNLALTDAPFLPRHWLVLLFVCVTIAGHVGLGLRTRDRTSPS